MFAFNAFTDFTDFFSPQPPQPPPRQPQQPQRVGVDELDQRLKKAIESAQKCEAESKAAESERESNDIRDLRSRQEEAVETARLIDVVNEKTKGLFDSEEQLRNASQELEILKLRILEMATENSDEQVELIESLRREESLQNVELAKEAVNDALRKLVF